MKFLLLTTFKKNFVKVWLCQQTSAVNSLVPPVDLVSIGTVLQNKGHQVQILDLRCQKNKPKFKPDAVIINLTTPSAKSDYQLLKKLPKDCHKIAFGTHAITFPKEFFQKSGDFVLYGDPEKAVLNLLQANFSKNGTVGVLTKKKPINKPALFDNLDDLPFLNLNLLDLTKYYIPYTRKGKKFTFLLSSRGCPFACTFCQNPFFFGRPYRRQSVKRMVAELKYLNEKFGIEDFIYLDATFNVEEKKVIDFCREIKKQNLKISWLVNVRVSPLSLKMLENMKQAGCYHLMFGVEDYELLENIKKRTTKKEIIAAFAKTKKVGIKADAYLMIFPDSPWPEKEYIKHILLMIKEINPDGFQCNVAIPLPGTPFFQKLLAQKKLIKNWDLYDAAREHRLPYVCYQNLFKVRRLVYLRYPFSNPANIIKIIFSTNPKSLYNLVVKYCQHIRNYLNI